MDAYDAIQGRYACRKFTQEQVSGDELGKLLEAANAAPVGMSDYDGFEVIVVQDDQLRATIDAGTAHGMPPMGDHPTYGAPTLVFICAKVNPEYPAVAYGGASCIAENVMIQAAALELASVYVMAVPTVMQSKPELLKTLQLRAGFLPLVMVAVGHAATSHDARKPARLSCRVL